MEGDSLEMVCLALGWITAGLIWGVAAHSLAVDPTPAGPFSRLDQDSDGVVSPREFLAGRLVRTKALDECTWHDRDRDRQLTRREFQGILYAGR